MFNVSTMCMVKLYPTFFETVNMQAEHKLASQTMVFTFAECQRVGLGISSVTECGVTLCELSEGMTGYI